MTEEKQSLRVGVVGAGDTMSTALDAAMAKLGHEDVILVKSGDKVFKTNGLSELVLVDNPDRYVSEPIYHKQKKRGSTNFTPRKKKRKKR